MGALVFVLPTSFLRRLQLSRNIGTYQRLRVPFFIKLTQEAPWLRRLAGERERYVRRDRQTRARFERDTWTRERFHLGLLTFTVLCSAVAAWRLQWSWCGTLAVSNILYNLYPIWLQQYLRLRAARLVR